MISSLLLGGEAFRIFIRFFAMKRSRILSCVSPSQFREAATCCWLTSRVLRSSARMAEISRMVSCDEISIESSILRYRLSRSRNSAMILWNRWSAVACRDSAVEIRSWNAFFSCSCLALKASHAAFESMVCLSILSCIVFTISSVSILAYAVFCAIRFCSFELSVFIVCSNTSARDLRAPFSCAICVCRFCTWRSITWILLFGSESLPSSSDICSFCKRTMFCCTSASLPRFPHTSSLHESTSAWALPTWPMTNSWFAFIISLVSSTMARHLLCISS
mmetsp:Transcript_89431/g.251868  ORF Transcript_89431/g.251868 Transcript_89431/m.251868 type:complete len:277 (+) Transcript_89431:182-1012(+)